VVAYESFTTRDTDFSSQLTKIKERAEFLFTPQYYNEVALIVKQAHELGFNNPSSAATAGVLPKPSAFAAQTATACFSAPIMPPPAPRATPRSSSTATSKSTATCPMMLRR
jgi:ABC-type branched-subunit amino acid transport system substrate-binding protein